MNLVLHQLRYPDPLYLYNTIIIMNTYRTPDLKMSSISASQWQLTKINNDIYKRRTIYNDSWYIYIILNILEIHKLLYKRKSEPLTSYKAHLQAVTLELKLNSLYDVVTCAVKNGHKNKLVSTFSIHSF